MFISTLMAPIAVGFVIAVTTFVVYVVIGRSLPSIVKFTLNTAVSMFILTAFNITIRLETSVVFMMSFIVFSLIISGAIKYIKRQ